MVLQLKLYNHGVWLPWQMADRLQKLINQVSRNKLWTYNWKTELIILLKWMQLLCFQGSPGEQLDTSVWFVWSPSG